MLSTQVLLKKLFSTNPEPDAVIHTSINFVQMWVDLQKKSYRVKMKEMVQYLSDWMLKKEQYIGPYSEIVVRSLRVLCVVLHGRRFLVFLECLVYSCTFFQTGFPRM